ncbi:MAG: hypothetical protein Kow0098_02340 [Ignavibacteriaceae bacterium]
MNYSEELLELLSRDELTPEQKMRLNELAESDQDNAALVQFYHLIKTTVKKSSVPSPDELRDYILIKLNQTPFNKYAYKKQQEIGQIIHSNPEIENEFKLLLSEYSEIEEFVADSLKVKSGQKKTEPAMRKWFLPSFRQPGRYLVTILLVLMISYAALYVYSQITIPGTYKIAVVEEDANKFNTRGRYSDYFTQSIAELENKNYDEAIKLLKEDIKQYPDDETIFYSYYILGITCLESAEKSYAGLFPHFDESKAEEGLKYLLLSAEKNNTGKYPDLVASAYFFSGKACVMLNMLDKAKEYFGKVIELRGSKMDEAKKIISDLE